MGLAGRGINRRRNLGKIARSEKIIRRGGHQGSATQPQADSHEVSRVTKSWLKTSQAKAGYS